MSLSIKPLLILPCALLLPNLSFASGDWQFGVIVGYEHEKSLYRFDNDDGSPFILPIIEYETPWFSISPLGIESDFYAFESGDWEFEMSTEIEFGLFNESRDESDSRIFAGMEDRDEATHWSLQAEWTTPVGVIESTYSHDIGDSYKGYIASLQYALPLYFDDQSFFAVAIGTDFLSKDYVDYYYGVRTNEVNADRAAYQGKSAQANFVAYTFSRELSQHWSVSHELKYSEVPDELKDSPLTENDDNVLSAGVNIIYKF